MPNGFKIEYLADHVHLKLEHSLPNAINEIFLNGFKQCLAQIPLDQHLIISGNGQFFCSGLDLFYVHRLNRMEMTHLIENFQDLLDYILIRSGNTIACIDGHAVAGGFIIASACDHAYCLPGNYKLGMNEHKLGITLPPLPQAILAFTHSDFIKDILQADEFYSRDEIGFLPHFSLIESMPIDFAEGKANAYRSAKIKDYLDAEYRQGMTDFLESWFSERAISARDLTAEKLKSKS